MKATRKATGPFLRATHKATIIRGLDTFTGPQGHYNTNRATLKSEMILASIRYRL